MIDKDEKQTFTAEDLAHITRDDGTQIAPAPYLREDLPAADRLKALTSLLHQGEAGEREYAANEDLVKRLVSEATGKPIVTGGGTIDLAAIQEREDRMRVIMQDAHRDSDQARRRYQAAQPELLRLAGEIEALRRGEKVAATPAKSVAKVAVDQIKVAITDYANLPAVSGEDENSVLDDRLWSEALPAFADLKLTPAQVEGLGKLFRTLEVTADTLRREDAAEAAKTALADAQKALANRYGAKWRDLLEPTNALLRRILPGGKSKQLMALRLENGTLFGDQPLVVEAMIEIARDLGRRQ